MFTHVLLNAKAVFGRSAFVRLRYMFTSGTQRT